MFLLAPAFAAPETQKIPVHEVDFEKALSIEGELVRPGVILDSTPRPPPPHPRLPIRESWAPEMKESVDAVK